ncbi:unnamed protein product [Polarella glacialis]|uniref:Uncharacterized protein n=1 Tax=Polarella glacialis TaxID=89957 RepID=A0A813HZ07_POLGL|nr:unnamed protein product [Polarella glacialis]
MAQAVSHPLWQSGREALSSSINMFGRQSQGSPSFPPGHYAAVARTRQSRDEESMSIGIGCGTMRQALQKKREGLDIPYTLVPPQRAPRSEANPLAQLCRRGQPSASGTGSRKREAQVPQQPRQHISRQRLPAGNPAVGRGLLAAQNRLHDGVGLLNNSNNNNNKNNKNTKNNNNKSSNNNNSNNNNNHNDNTTTTTTTRGTRKTKKNRGK